MGKYITIYQHPKREFWNFSFLQRYSDSDYKYLERKHDSLLEECDSLMEERDSLMEERDSLKEERDSLMEKRDSLKEERDSLMEERDSLMEQYIFYHEKGAEYRETLDHVKKKLDDANATIRTLIDGISQGNFAKQTTQLEQIHNKGTSGLDSSEIAELDLEIEQLKEEETEDVQKYKEIEDFNLYAALFTSSYTLILELDKLKGELRQKDSTIEELRIEIAMLKEKKTISVRSKISNFVKDVGYDKAKLVVGDCGAQVIQEVIKEAGNLL